jgi:phosphatidate cytidylyltransferase
MNETLTRTLSGVLYIIILISATLYLNSFLVLFGLFLLLVVVEFCNLVHLQKLLPIGISIISYFLFSYFPENKTVNLVILLLTLLVGIKAILFLYKKSEAGIDTTSKYLFLFGYIIFPILLITKIPFVENVFNPKIIISIFILIWANDTMAFVVGKSIGKRKLFERISPKKTIEGFFGGLVFAVIFSVLIAKYFMLQSMLPWIIIALIVGIFGTIGDLIESKFKRMAGVKDSGKIMPGHGGILDRLDSIIFVGPFVFLFYQILNYVS